MRPSSGFDLGNIERIVEIIFQGDDRVTGVLQNVRGGMGQMGDWAEAAAAPLARVTDGILAVDAALAALVAGGMALAVNESGKFSDSFNEITTLLDASDNHLATFRSDILAYASDSKKSIEDINGALYAAVSAGVDYELSLGTLSRAEQLAIAAKADLKDSILVLASTLNAYGESVDKAEHYSDVFFTTVKLGQTTLPELAATLGNIVGVAAAGNVPIEMLGAAIAALTASGLPTTQAVTGLRQAIAAIIGPSEEAKKMAESLGIAFGSGELKAKGLDGILRQVYDATGGNTEQMKRLFGSVEALNAVLILGSDTSGRFKHAIEEMGNVTGATEAAYRKMADNFTLINQNLANNIKLTLIKAGDEISGSYAQLVPGLADIFKAIQGAIDTGSFDPLFKAVNAFGANLGNLLEKIAEATPEALAKIDWTGLLDALGDLGDSVAKFFGDLDLSNADDLARALQTVVDSIESLVRVTQGIWEYFQPLFEAVGQAIKEVNSLDEETQTAFGNILGAAQLVVTAGAGIAAAFAIIKESGAEIGNVFNLVAGTIQGVWNTIQTSFDVAAQLIVDLITFFVDLAEGITSVIPGLGGMNQKLQDTRQELAGISEAIAMHRFEQMEEAANGFGRAWSGITGEVYEADTAIKDYHDDLLGIPNEVRTKVEGEIDQDLIDWSENPEIKDLIIKTDLDEKSATETVAKVNRVMKEAIDKSPVEVKVDPKVDMAKIKEVSDIVQKSMEWKAKLDIAEVQANAKKVESMFESIGEGIKSTGDLLGDLFGELGDASAWDKLGIQSQIEAENKRRQQEFDLQKKLVESEIALNEEKLAKLESGEALITIQGDGLQPHLEAFMWEILSAIQVRANEEASEFLLGI